MIEIATVACLALALVTVVLTATQALRTRPVAVPDLASAALLELGVLFYVGVRVYELVAGPRPPSIALGLAYLIGIVLIMPVTTLLGIAEKSRWGPIVLGVGALVVCVLFARIDQVWSPHG